MCEERERDRGQDGGRTGDRILNGMAVQDMAFPDECQLQGKVMLDR